MPCCTLSVNTGGVPFFLLDLHTIYPCKPLVSGERCEVNYELVYTDIYCNDLITAYLTYLLIIDKQTDIASQRHPVGGLRVRPVHPGYLKLSNY